jgi:creatinine amidohydrolase
MMDKVFLWDMTYEEAGEAFKEADFIVLPTGSIEQHSIHLPVSTDSIRAEELTRYLVTHSGSLRMVMLPTLYYGQSKHHIHFPGTMTLSEETYMQVLKEIAWSVKQHGGKRLLIVNFHGGNVAPIQVARLIIEREIGLKVYFVGWSSFASDLVREWAPDVPYGHSGFYETSMILKFRPDLVVKEKMKRQEQRFQRESIERQLTRGTAAAYFDDNYITGGIGDPTLASAELAEKIIPTVNQRVIEALIEDMKYE